MDFEEILAQINGWGFYQKRLYFILTFAFEVLATQNVVFMMFGGASPNWSCKNSSDSLSIFTNDTLYGCKALSSCDVLAFDENIHSVVTEFWLFCDQRFVADMITTVQMVGLSLGGLLWGQMAEIHGRKKILLMIYTLLFTSGIVASLSVNWVMFIITYFFVGVGLGGSLTVEFTLIQEFIATDKRLFVAVLNGWPFGVILFCGISYFVRHWRYILFATNAAGLPFLLAFFWIDESPRWLLQHNRLSEAHQVLCKIAKTNGREIIELSKLKSIESSQRISRKYSYHHLFSTKSIARHSLALTFSFLVVSCVSYGLLFNVKNLAGDRFFNAFLMACLGCLTQWPILFLNKWFGRRAIHQFSLLVAGVACFVVMIFEILDEDKVHFYITSIFAALGNAALNPTWNVMSLYCVELFPTVIRNLAGGFCSMAARIGGIIAPMLVYMCYSWKPLPFLVFCLLALMNLVVAFLFLPETSGKPLSDALAPKCKKNCSSEPSTDSKSLIISDKNNS